ncbi:MAG: hypothetical protein QOF51_2863 [Chloroflexota bacterium]|nr:hypothetical protein [Chloroflexota bacterium]
MQQGQLVLDLGVAAGDRGQSLPFGGWVAGAGDELERLELEEAGKQHDGSLAWERKSHLEVRNGDAGDGEASGQIRLRPSCLYPQGANALTERF